MGNWTPKICAKTISADCEQRRTRALRDPWPAAPRWLTYGSALHSRPSMPDTTSLVFITRGTHLSGGSLVMWRPQCIQQCSHAVLPLA